MTSSRRRLPFRASLWFQLVLMICVAVRVHAQQDQNPLTMNGGSVLAMAGKDCVALAVDKRFGSGPALVNVQTRPVLMCSKHLLVAFTGLEGDVQSLQEELTAQVALKYTRGLGFGSESKTISPRAMNTLTSHVLYGRRQAPYYVEPLIVGLEAVSEQEVRPFLSSMDIIGAASTSDAFVCAGAATESLFGTAEALWKPDLQEDELVEVCGKAFLSALERDCLSGYGAVVYLLRNSGMTEYQLESRND